MIANLATIPLALVLIAISWQVWLQAICQLLEPELLHRLQTGGLLPRWGRAFRWFSRVMSIPMFLIWATLAGVLGIAGAGLPEFDQLPHFARKPLVFVPIVNAGVFIWKTTLSKPPARPIVGDLMLFLPNLPLVRYAVCRYPARRISLQAVTLAFGALPGWILT